MSCEIYLTAAFEGIDKFLQKFRAENAENDTIEEKNSISEYEIAISPMGEILVFAKSSWLLICGSKWDSNLVEGPKMKYSPNWHGHVQCKHGEKITSILCLPFFSYGQTVHGADWTCIVVGFSSGCVRFYTEGMQELAYNTLHAEPVLGIKAFCPALVQQGKTLKQDNNDIYVLYETVLCVFNGPNLSQTLLNRRNQMAKGITPQTHDGGAHILLDFKKYGFAGQESISDACYLGQTFMSSYTTFDHLVTASYAGGFSSNYRASSPQTSLIMTSGSKPFIGFHFTLESGTSPVLADVALAVANKIKTSVAANLTDWFGFGGKKTVSQDKTKEGVNDQAEKLNCRFGLCDLRREAQSIICSPDGSYSAVSDSLGRVILLENSTGIALRLWKGFRDAQCGFIQTDEEVLGKSHRKSGETKTPNRRALFVVIYAPKKGLIEIFCSHNGRKVCTFKVTKCGRLIYNPRGCIAPISAGGCALNLGQVLFVSEKGLTEFIVPFHCSLAEDSGKTSRDLHVLKKIKLLLNTEWNSPKFVDDVQNSAGELKTDEVRFQVIDLMLNNRNTSLESLKAVLAVFLDNFCSPGRDDSGPKKMIAYTKVMLNLLKFYEYLSEINDVSARATRQSKNLSSINVIEEMRTTEKELDLVLKFIAQIKEIEGFRKSNARVAFKKEKTSLIQEYLSAFDWNKFLSGLEKQEKPCRLTLKPDVEDEKGAFLQEHLFKGVLIGSGSSLDEWSTHAESCCLNPTDLAISLLSYWYHQSPTNDLAADDLKNFVEVLKAICSLNDPNIVSIEYNVESPWWSRLRAFIASTPSTVRGLFAALCCRSVTIFVEQERELAHKKGGRKHKTGSSVHTDWVTLSKDICQWDILITQLQDVALLNAVLNLKLSVPGSGAHGLPQVSFEFEHQCLSSIQQNGTGRVSELVAKWLVQFGIEPSAIVDKADIEFLGSEGKNVDVEVIPLEAGLDKAQLTKGNDGKIPDPLNYLALLKSRFPYSLTTSSLLSNLCWEYTAHWFKRVSDLTYLEAAVQCLGTVPATKIKYGISFLSWSTYFQQKVECLSRIVNRVGKVPKGKLCMQEIGLGSEQVPDFLKLISNYLTILLHSDVEWNLEFSINREAIWQNCTSAPSSSLMSIALAQPRTNTHLVLLLLQVTTTLHLMSSLNIKQQKVFSSLFDNVDSFNFTLTRNVQPSEHKDRELEEGRKQFLQKAITAAVQTVHLVQCFQKGATRESGDDDNSTSKHPPSATLDVSNYKKWLQMILDLATVWDVCLDDLRRHQICELYANGLDRMAEEVIPSVNTKEVLASQILVVAGKRLKYLIQDSKNSSAQMSHLSLNLSEWLKCLDIENYKHQNETLDDIEVMTRYVASWLPEDHPDEKLAVDVIETLSFFRP